MNIIEQLKKENIAVNCIGRNDSYNFLEIMKDNGIKWVNGMVATEYNPYHAHVSDTCFECKDGCLLYSYRDYYKLKDYKTITFEEFLKEYKGEEKKMCSNGKLNKGIENVMVQDMFRAVTDKQTGMIGFNPVKMVNLCFVKFNNGNKIYAFQNPSDARLKEGTEVCVPTSEGNAKATVIDSVKIQNKYVKNLIHAMSGKHHPLKSIIGVYKTVEKTELVKIKEK